MARKSEDPLKKLRLDGDDLDKIEVDAPRGEPTVPKFDAGAATTLKAIAMQLGVPVKRFYGVPDSLGPDAATDEADRGEQEQRLLNAFRRLPDAAMRQSLIELAETLCPEL